MTIGTLTASLMPLTCRSQLKARLRDQKRGLLDPRGLFVQCWDIMTFAALVFTIFVTPYEVRHLWQRSLALRLH